MNPPIRLRRHTDGRVAIQVPADRSAWSLVQRGGQQWVHEQLVLGDGWSELFVAELPEPDGWVQGAFEGTLAPYWSGEYFRHLQAYDDGEGIEVDGGFRDDLNAIRSDALKLLAAVAACERYRAEGKVT